MGSNKTKIIILDLAISYDFIEEMNIGLLINVYKFLICLKPVKVFKKAIFSWFVGFYFGLYIH